ncbi:MAG: tRNA (guanosine(37)-N1)-methyltransferase TrmD [Deltaproteobacteria bacterium]|jgi:tRNA (guanine37-N1)-methyltransferase|nr:tRNA (guanosine(37)-N1)-methyltransferase TrmD [Deltaproteobacteria bacterium]
MRFDVLTLFPGLFGSFLAESLLAKALARGLVSVEIVDIRDFAPDRHRTADDRPFGGGPGMVLAPGPLSAALDSRLSLPGPVPLVIHLTPAGRRLDQALARELAARRRLILVCGRYGGVDRRVAELYPGLELSMGDYVLNGGEVPAMAVIEAVSRLVPGFLGERESLEGESFSEGILGAPLYTRPRVFRGLEVPGILLSGNHREIDLWRRREAARLTRLGRPDLLDPDLRGNRGSAVDPREDREPGKDPRGGEGKG